VCSFAPERKANVEVKDGELVLLDRKKLKATTAEKQRWYSQLLTVAQGEGYKPGWVGHKYRERFGCWPRGMKEVPVPVSREVAGWLKHLQIRAAKAKEARHAHA
jgi:hypothetical protein